MSKTEVCSLPSKEDDAKYQQLLTQFANVGPTHDPAFMEALDILKQTSPTDTYKEMQSCPMSSKGGRKRKHIRRSRKTRKGGVNSASRRSARNSTEEEDDANVDTATAAASIAATAAETANVAADQLAETASRNPALMEASNTAATHAASSNIAATAAETGVQTDNILAAETSAAKAVAHAAMATDAASSADMSVKNKDEGRTKCYLKVLTKMAMITGGVGYAGYRLVAPFIASATGSPCSNWRDQAWGAFAGTMIDSQLSCSYRQQAYDSLVSNLTAAFTVAAGLPLGTMLIKSPELFGLVMKYLLGKECPHLYEPMTIDQLLGKWEAIRAGKRESAASNAQPVSSTANIEETLPDPNASVARRRRGGRKSRRRHIRSYKKRNGRKSRRYRR